MCVWGGGGSYLEGTQQHRAKVGKGTAGKLHSKGHEDYSENNQGYERLGSSNTNNYISYNTT